MAARKGLAALERVSCVYDLLGGVVNRGRCGRSLCLGVSLEDQTCGELRRTAALGRHEGAVGDAEGVVGAIRTEYVAAAVDRGEPCVAISSVGPYGALGCAVVQTLAGTGGSVLQICSDVALYVVDHGVELVAAVNLFSVEIGSCYGIGNALIVLTAADLVRCVQNLAQGFLIQIDLVRYVFLGLANDAGVINYGNYAVEGLGNARAVARLDGSGQHVGDLLLGHIGNVYGVEAVPGALNDLDLIVVNRPGNGIGHLVENDLCNYVVVNGGLFRLILIQAIQISGCVCNGINYILFALRHVTCREHREAKNHCHYES